MSKQEKKRKIIYDLLNAEIEPKYIFEIIPVSEWAPSSSNMNPLDYAIGCFRKRNKCNVPSRYGFCLRLLLRRNGINFLQIVSKVC